MRFESRGRRPRREAVPFVPLLVCLATTLAAYGAETGIVRGTVHDTDGAPLAGATVRLTNDSLLAAPRIGLTDASGAFLFPALPPGAGYAVTVSFPGRATVGESDIVVTAGEGTRLDVALPEEGTLRQQVSVRATREVVDLDEPSGHTHYGAELIEALPILGRNYQDVLTLAPGVTDVNGDGNPNIHGARQTDVVTMLDGISTVDPLTGKAGVQLNLESIQDIEVKTSAAAAEFGRAQGGFANIITKSGGNDFEGTLKFYWRSSRLDGDGAGSDDVRLHAGVGEHGLRDVRFSDEMPFLSLSGPIRRDCAWFYVSLESIRREDPVNAVSAAFVTGVREERDFAKLTWQASPNQRLTFSFNRDPQELLDQGLNSFTREESGYTTRAGGTLATIRDTAVLSPTVALESALAELDARPGQIPNLGPDTNHDGVLFVDRNHDGFPQASERDPGEDYDDNGAFDVFEDGNHNHQLNAGEDKDHNGMLTVPSGCEGLLREDVDCDGRLDNVNEDVNHNGILDNGEDLDRDGYLDLGIEDRNHNGVLDDTPFPATTYPYGELRPVPADRPYTIDLLSGIDSGPFFIESSDRRQRTTWRQDLSIFLPQARGSHDLKAGYAIERESFHRLDQPNQVWAQRVIPQVCKLGICVASDDQGIRASVNVLLPNALAFDEAAQGLSAGTYLQDTWRPLPNLSLSLGLRFDREVLRADGYRSFDPALEAATLPRLEDLSGRSVALAGLRPSFSPVTSYGIPSDPLVAAAPDPTASIAPLLNGLQMASLSRLTRPVLSIGILSGPLAALVPSFIVNGQLNTQALAAAGVRPQVPDRFSLTNDNLSPRLHVSWDPLSTGREKFFAGWGRFYDKLFLNTVVGEQGPEWVGRYYEYDPDGLRGTDSLATGFPGVTPDHHIGAPISFSPPSITQVDRGLQTPFCDELTLGFEREIRPEVLFGLRYIERSYREQLQDVDVNHHTEIDPTTGQPSDRIGLLIKNVVPDFPDRRVPDGKPDLFIDNPFFNQVLRIGNNNFARYHGIEMTLSRRLMRRWAIDASYTYSRAVGAAEDFQSSLGNDPSTVEAEFGYLDYDQRHVVKVNTALFLPHDWQLGVASSWSSGLPFSIVSRFFAMDDDDYEQYRTVYGYTDSLNGHSGFVSLHRNSERNDSVLDLNLRAKKGFVLGRFTGGLFLEVFNALNTDDLRILSYEPNRGSAPSVTQPGGSPSAGGQGVASVSNGLQIDAVRRFGRRFQLGIQLSF